MGQKWLDNCSDALQRCVVEIVVSSQASVAKPWINFEAGAGWIRGIPVIPLCHSGLSPAHLPIPLSLLQAAKATDGAGLGQVFSELAKTIDVKPPVVDFTEFINKVTAFEATYLASNVCHKPDEPGAEVGHATKQPVSSFPVLRSWGELTSTERDFVTARKNAFVADALEITGHPELYGRWELVVEGSPQDGQVTLQTQIFPDAQAALPLTVQIFSLGVYPLRPPQVQVRLDDCEAAGPDLVARIKNLCPHVVWEDRYRVLMTGRLIHLADAVTDFQNPAALFKYHARALDPERTRTWQLIGDSPNVPRLVGRYQSANGALEVTIEPGQYYPVRAPVVRCSPIPRTNAWLGAGELNWRSLAKSGEQDDCWRQLLSVPNPIATLTGLLDGLLAAP